MHFSTRAAVIATSLTLFLSGCGSSSDTETGPAIVTQPASVTIIDGSNGVLSVVVKGSGLAYQWYKDGAPIDGATAAIYTATAAGSYYVVVTHAEGSITSGNAVVSVTTAPVITAQPASATILTGTSQVLKVGAEGADLTYQWYKDGVAIGGATAATYSASSAGSYMVQVLNAAGSAQSTAAVIAVSPNVTAPVIITEPRSQTVNAGTGVTFSVAVSGTSVAYQWYRNDVPLAGANGPTYTITAANANSAGIYQVVATNTAGTATSTTAELKVNVLGDGANTAAVVNAANAFLATLTAQQKTVATDATSSTTVLFDYSLANANQWTNLPGNRHGLRLNGSALNSEQLAAANAVIAKALSATGIALLGELRAADQVLATAQANGTGTGMPGGTGMPPTGTFPTDGTGTPMAGTFPPDGAGTPPTGTGGGMAAMGYGSDLYSIAFVGTPSKTSPWILQVIGHHLAYNITYNASKVSATPAFIGVEPPDWSVAADGTVTVTNNASTAGYAHAPMERQRAAMYNLAEAIHADSTASAAAKLAGTFTDVLMGASGNSDGNYKSLVYPTSGRGLQYPAMNDTQKAYVRAAIEAWVNTQAADVAAALLGEYLSDEALADTYVAYGVGQNGTKADFSAYPNAKAVPLDAQHSYMRIDGPRVWIEFVVQQGVVYGTNVHYHTIWRDKTADYGGSF
ncbi:DUF3500 domain-containing protein [Massilia sp. METH4]|uniref:DUF3500 domain-containing protein n=1 Tax=Massilia sp. METH4 TaxID=3123041 RepID=UPI0030CC6B44